jgi:nitrite reductase/ring-hydroxylating ferredoxin subunit
MDAGESAEAVPGRLVDGALPYQEERCSVSLSARATATELTIQGEVIDAGSLEELRVNRVLSVDVGDGERVLIIARRRSAVAIAARCPHMGRSLDGARIGRRSIQCPGHGYSYDLRSGACRTPHRLSGQLKRYQVWFEGNRVLVSSLAE